MRKTPILLALLLAGCASTEALRGGKPDIDAMTTKPAERVAGCVGDEFEKTNVNVAFAPITTFSTRPTANGYSISGIQSGGFGTDTIILVDVSKAETGTHVMMFDHFLAGGGKWIALVRGCL